MIPVSLLSALGIAILLPILSAKGKGWRGLWFGLAIASLVVSAFLFMGATGADLAVEQAEQRGADTGIAQGVKELFDVGLPVLALGSFLGCLIAGCIYRKPSA